MNEIYFPSGVITENLSGSNEIITYNSNFKLITSGLNVNILNDYELFYNSNSKTWDNNSIETMVLDTQVRGHSNYSVSSNQISVSESGEYIINVDITLLAFDGGRKNSLSALALNGVEIAGTRMSAYERLGNHGASCSSKCIINLIPTDVVEILTTRTNGSGNLEQIANGTRLYIKRGFDL